MSKFQEAYKYIKPTEEVKERLLENILSENKENDKMAKKINFKKAVPMALAAAVVLAVGVSMMNGNENEDIVAPPQNALTATAPQPPRPPVSAPMPGMRKFLNYNGSRYEFINNGEIFENVSLGEKLGSLDIDIASNPAENNKLDLGTTFASGSEIYEVEGVDSFFRIAVNTPDGICIAQNVASVEGTFDIAKLFESADFLNNTESIEIWDHFDREKLSEINEKDIESFLKEAALSKKAELSDEDYQAIGKAQSEGKSFRIVLKLKDAPDYKLYIIPEMNISMIGDSRLYLPDTFNESFGSYFADLRQGPPIVY